MNVRTMLSVLTAALVLVQADARAAVKLPKIFGSHMVVQRDKPVTVWGWPRPMRRSPSTSPATKRRPRPTRTATGR